MAKKTKNGEKKSKGAPPDLFAALNQAARASRSALARRLTVSGLYAGQDALMLALDAEDGQTPSAIAAHLGVRAPTITKTINRLAEKGFVMKTASDKDARLALVHLTDGGRAAIAEIREAVAASEEAATAGLSGKEIKSLVKLLRKVDRNLQHQQGVETAKEAEPLA